MTSIVRTCSISVHGSARSVHGSAQTDIVHHAQAVGMGSVREVYRVTDTQLGSDVTVGLREDDYRECAVAQGEGNP